MSQNILLENTLFVASCCLLACCGHNDPSTLQPFYEKEYALPIEAKEWAQKAPLKDLCQGTKNWRHKHIREAALNEIKERDIDTRQCYYTGMELTP